MPPGVSVVKPLPAQTYVPPELLIHAIVVDWTDPRLSVRLEIPKPRHGSAPDWGTMASAAEGSLLIQLSEPATGTGERALALDAEPAASPAPYAGGPDYSVENSVRSKGADRNEAHIGGIAPWTYSGPGASRQPGWNSALAAGGATVGVRWLGTANEWTNQPPEGEFRDRLILSSLNPITGRGTFFLVINRSGRRQKYSTLTPWLKQAIPAEHLVAIHSAGPDAQIGSGGWKLGLGTQESAQAKAGAVLVLAPRAPGDLRDFARLHGTTVTSSSREIGYPVESIVSGRLWPIALRPPVWVSRTSESRPDEIPWVELQFEAPPDIEAIRLVYAGAAGWSSDANPAELEVQLKGSKAFDAELAITVAPKGADSSLFRFPRPFTASTVRVVWKRNSTEDVPSPARLMAIQVWGRSPSAGS